VCRQVACHTFPSPAHRHVSPAPGGNSDLCEVLRRVSTTHVRTRSILCNCGLKLRGSAPSCLVDIIYLFVVCAACWQAVPCVAACMASRLQTHLTCCGCWCMLKEMPSWLIHWWLRPLLLALLCLPVFVLGAALWGVWLHKAPAVGRPLVQDMSRRESSQEELELLLCMAGRKPCL
jgi:hypothetical protein